MNLSRFILTPLVLAMSVFAGDTSEVRKAPEVSFNLPGQGQKLLSQYRGKVVMIEFILTTCPHCQAAAKVNTKLQNEYGARGFQVMDLAINAYDNGGTDATAPALVQAFANTYGAAFPVGWVNRDMMMSFMNFSIMDRMVVPQMVLIDRKGYIHYQTPAGSGPEWEKMMNEPTVRAHIEELLAMPGGTTKVTRLTSVKKPS